MAKKLIITEAQERMLAKILREELQYPEKKEANEPYCIDPEKVLIVKRFLDGNFTPHDYENNGENGMPCKIKIFSMNASDGTPLKYLYAEQLQDLLIDKFQKMFMDKNERATFMARVLKEWENGTIGVNGTLSVNFLNEGLTTEEMDERASITNTSPTERQKKAGNYRKGHFSIKGMPITIENPKGSLRSWTDEDGTEGKTAMTNHYGYFTNTTGNGKDGDAVDVYIGTDIENIQKIYVIDQYIHGQFDESKVMLGFSSEKSAMDAYNNHHDSEWKGTGKITTVELPVFKKWLYRGHKQRKPFAKYILIQNKKLKETN